LGFLENKKEYIFYERRRMPVDTKKKAKAAVILVLFFLGAILLWTLFGVDTV